MHAAVFRDIFYDSLHAKLKSHWKDSYTKKKKKQSTGK